MKEKPTQEELNEMIAAIRSGDKIKAKSLYISSTNKGLTEAQKFVNELMEKLKNEKEER